MISIYTKQENVLHLLNFIYILFSIFKFFKFCVYFCAKQILTTLSLKHWFTSFIQ